MEESTATTATPATAVLTAEIKRAIKRADNLSVDFETDGSATLRLSKRIESSDPFERDRDRSISYKGFAARTIAGHRDAVRVIDPASFGSVGDRYEVYSDDNNTHAPRSGTWSILSLQYHHNVLSAFAALPVGAELRFWVSLDSLTNLLAVKARLHGDVLGVTALKDGKPVAEFQLDHVITAHNSARFGVRW